MFVARREKEDNLYIRLQERSIEMLQQLSGEVWSDFNPHDPGVTMLDILNYALLELNYKLDFPFEEYLGGKHGGKLHMQRFGVPASEDIFSDSIVTPADYEKLILGSNIDGVKNCRVTLNERGLYLIILDIADEADKHGIQTEVEKLYHANRNLCENLGGVVFDKINERVNRPRSERPAIRPDLHTIRSSGMSTGEYRSVQFDFPDCYGINENGIPVGVTEEHHARIRQLKGYLLVFDYLIGHVSVQAAGASGLFELSGRTPRYKLPSINIPGIGELIDRERITSAAIGQNDFRDQQKSRYLDMLDVIYGEDTSTLFTHCAKDLSEVNRMRAELIAQLPRLNAERFRSFNLLDENPGSIPGVERFISALTGSPWHFLAKLAGECSSFYLMEHILLDGGDTGTVENDENHTLSVIVPYWVQKLYDPSQYESLIMDRLPAHLEVRFLWLHVDKLYAFERLYFPWKKALAARDKQLAGRFAFEIRRFLKYNTPDT